jgi:hypothetical protein
MAEEWSESNVVVCRFGNKQAFSLRVYDPVQKGVLYEVAFSYSTPVAMWLAGVGYIETEKKWSRTTSGHIRYFVGYADTKKVPQVLLDGLLARPQEAITRIREHLKLTPVIFVIPTPKPKLKLLPAPKPELTQGALLLVEQR